MNDYRENAFKVKKEGGMVGWFTSSFPVEIPECLGLTVVCPENHSASVSAAGKGDEYCEKAERAGYSNDICAYAKINLGYCETPRSEADDLPMPDFLLCCTNICHQLVKWYEALSRRLNIPLFLLDIPYAMEGEADEETLRYVESQYKKLIADLCAFTGATFSEERLKEVMAITSATGKKWLEITTLAKHKPSPYNGFDLFVYMAAIVCLRTKQRTLDVLTALCEDMKEKIAKGRSTYPVREKKRIVYEGIPCWPYLYPIQTPLLDKGINVTGSIYANLFAVTYGNFSEMIKAYCSVPNAVSLEKGIEKRKKIMETAGCNGVAFHLSRSCRIWSGCYYEMERRLSDECGVPTVMFDGDQAEAKNFSMAQYETRMQAFSEVLEGEDA